MVLQHRRFTYLVLLVLAVGVIHIPLGGAFKEILVFAAIFAILSLSLDLIMGHMGQFSFGHAAFFGLGGYTTALLNLKLGVSPWLGFPAAFVVTAALGFILGFIILRTLREFYLGLVTLGFAMIATQVVNHWWDFTFGPLGLWGISPPVIALPGLPEIVVQSASQYYYLVLVLLIFTIYLINRFLRSRFGRGLRALRENEELASAIGISPFRHYLITFTLACGLAGLAGAAYVHYLGFVDPTNLGLTYMFQMLVMVLVGGMGTLGGPVLGSFIFVWVALLFPALGHIRLLILGVILVVSIIFLPKGLFPSLESAWNLLLQRAWPKRRLE